MGLKARKVMRIHSYNGLELFLEARYTSVVPYLPVVTDDFFLELLISNFCIATADYTINWKLYTVVPKGDYYLVLFKRIYG